MKTMFAAIVCVVIDDEQDEAGQVLPSRNPLDDLVERIRRRGQYADDTVSWRDADGQKVA